MTARGRQYPDGPLVPEPGVVFGRLQQQDWPSFAVEYWPPAPPPEGFCDVYWGSHGCMHPRGHGAGIPHECDCCECEHHPYPDWPDTGVRCVAKPPYYGPETRFYGDDDAA